MSRQLMPLEVKPSWNAIQALDAALGLPNQTPAAPVLEAIQQCCLDPSLSVRKQALVSLGSILTAFEGSKAAQNAWVDATLPLVMDKEDSIQSKCIEIIGNHLLSPLIGSATAETGVVWQLLQCVDEKQELQLRLARREV